MVTLFTFASGFRKIFVGTILFLGQGSEKRQWLLEVEIQEDLVHVYLDPFAWNATFVLPDIPGCCARSKERP